MKRLAVVLGMAMLLCTPVYANEPDAVAVYQEMEAKTKDMPDMDAYYDFILDMSYQGQSMSGYLKMDVKANHLDVPAEYRFRGDMQFGVDISGLYEQNELGPGSGMDIEDTRMDMNGSFYYADGMYYMDMLGMKMKQPMAMEDMMNTVHNMQSAAGQNNLEYMQDMKLRTDGDLRIVSYTMDGEKLNGLVRQMLEMMDVYESEGIQIEFGNISGEYEINPDGYYTKARMNMEIYITQDNQTVKMVLKGDVSLRNPGQPVNVELPDLSQFELKE